MQKSDKYSLLISMSSSDAPVAIDPESFEVLHVCEPPPCRKIIGSAGGKFDVEFFWTDDLKAWFSQHRTRLAELSAYSIVRVSNVAM